MKLKVIRTIVRNQHHSYLVVNTPEGEMIEKDVFEFKGYTDYAYFDKGDKTGVSIYRRK